MHKGSLGRLNLAQSLILHFEPAQRSPQQPGRTVILAHDLMAKLHARVWPLLLVGLLFTPVLLITGESSRVTSLRGCGEFLVVEKRSKVSIAGWLSARCVCVCRLLIGQ